MPLIQTLPPPQPPEAIESSVFPYCGVAKKAAELALTAGVRRQRSARCRPSFEQKPLSRVRVALAPRALLFNQLVSPRHRACLAHVAVSLFALSLRAHGGFWRTSGHPHRRRRSLALGLGPTEGGFVFALLLEGN